MCIQGFRGYGYSKEFVEGMSAVVNLLKAEPFTLIEVVDSRDDICGPCPHLAGGVCRQSGEESAERRAKHDRRILDRLGLKVGERLLWSEVLDRIRASIVPDDMAQLCGDCRWMSWGFCADGLEGLRSQDD